MHKGLWFFSGFLVAAALAAAWIFLLAPHGGRPGQREARAQEPLVRAEVQARNAERFAALDANANGAIEAAEWEAFHLSRFDAADRNKDGLLTREEMKAARKDKPNADADDPS